MKVRDLIQVLEHDGWRLYRHEGTSHRQYKHPLKSGKVTVPGQLGRDVPVGTFKGIIKQAGIRL